MNLFWAEIDFPSSQYDELICQRFQYHRIEILNQNMFRGCICIKKIPAQNSSKHQKSPKNIQNYWNFLA